MVNWITAYQIINRAVLAVSSELITLEQLEVETKSNYVRLDESPISISETRKQLDACVVLAHDLTQYVNKFYAINLQEDTSIWIDYLIGHTMDEIDLTEFGDYV